MANISMNDWKTPQNPTIIQDRKQSQDWRIDKAKLIDEEPLAIIVRDIQKCVAPEGVTIAQS